VSNKMQTSSPPRWHVEKIWCGEMIRLYKVEMPSDPLAELDEAVPQVGDLIELENKAGEPQKLEVEKVRRCSKETFEVYVRAPAFE
jgi:hypothetical protein